MICSLLCVLPSSAVSDSFVVEMSGWHIDVCSPEQKMVRREGICVVDVSGDVNYWSVDQERFNLIQGGGEGVISKRLRSIDRIKSVFARPYEALPYSTEVRCVWWNKLPFDFLVCQEVLKW